VYSLTSAYTRGRFSPTERERVGATEDGRAKLIQPLNPRKKLRGFGGLSVEAPSTDV
jgi:hypothetical protein